MSFSIRNCFSCCFSQKTHDLPADIKKAQVLDPEADTLSLAHTSSIPAQDSQLTDRTHVSEDREQDMPIAEKPLEDELNFVLVDMGNYKKV